MFTAEFPSIQFEEPWASSSDERLSSLVKKTRRIVYFYEHPDTSTFRYRVLNPTLTLASDPDYDTSASWFDLRDLKSNIDFIEHADALVLCRVRYNAAVARLIARARAKRIPVLFDCDDLIFDIERLHLIVHSLNLDQESDGTWEDWFSYIGRVGATLRLCDGIITTNQYLADRALEYMPQLRTAVVPNYLNPDQQDYSTKLFQAKKASGWRRDENIHIGYFSGSPTHARDFAVALPAVKRLLENDPRIILRVVGFGAFDNEFEIFGDRVEYHPLQNYLSLQKLIAEVEINIAPLQENQFTNCKSELKFFEAAMCGTLTLATPTYTFKNSVKHESTGFLVPSYGWDDALQKAVALVEDKNNYINLVEAAFKDIKKRYGWDKQASVIVDAIFASQSTNRNLSEAT